MMKLFVGMKAGWIGHPCETYLSSPVAVGVPHVVVLLLHVKTIDAGFDAVDHGMPCVDSVRQHPA
jgi:hypothetical protein